MEANSIATILVGLIGLSLLFWLTRLMGSAAGECRIVR